MAFRLVNPITTVDEERGVKIRLSPGFHDVVNVVSYVYQNSVISFEFDTSAQFGVELPAAVESVDRVGGRAEVARSINGRSVRSGIKQAMGAKAISEEALDVIMQDILDGIFSLSTQDGVYLKKVHGYRVYFA